MSELKMMKKNRFKIMLITLLPLAILINIISSKTPEFIEKYYSLWLNKYIVMFLSSITGVFPFSIYEIIMYAIVIFIAAFIFVFIYKITRGKQ